MSGTATRTSKRQIRKAIGPEVLEVLTNHEDALTHHTEQIRRLTVNDADGLEFSKVLSRQLLEANDEHYRLSAKLANELLPRTNTFLGRLVWLVRGNRGL